MDGLGGGNNNASNNQLNLRDFGPGRTLVLVNGKKEEPIIHILRVMEMLHLTGTEYQLVLLRESRF